MSSVCIGKSINKASSLLSFEIIEEGGGVFFSRMGLIKITPKREEGAQSIYMTRFFSLKKK
jgi:hypothetical protein